MIEPEFSRLIDLRQVNDQPLVLEPDETEKRRLSGRFGITAIDTMRAQVKLAMAGEDVTVQGRLTAAIVQPCAISGEDFPVLIDEPISLRFTREHIAHAPDEEIEITADDCDVIEYEGTAFDLGEAIAQTLALAIDPFAEGPDADRARAEHNLSGDADAGPFAMLRSLTDKP